MSALPGKRHRTLAASSMVEEADIAAIEAATIDLTHGVHGAMVSQVPHAGAHAPGAGWTPFPTGSYWVSGGGAGSVLWVPFPLWAGDAIRTLEALIQPGSASVVTIEMVELDLEDRTSLVVAADVEVTAAGVYAKRSFDFVTPQRPRGLRIKRGRSHRLKITAGSTTDRFLGALIGISHPKEVG